jgi:hypothetical protein
MVDDFVGDVALERWIGMREGKERGVDEVRGVVDEVFGFVALATMDAMRVEAMGVRTRHLDAVLLSNGYLQ